MLFKLQKYTSKNILNKKSVHPGDQQGQDEAETARIISVIKIT